MGQALSAMYSQSFFIPEPELTEKNVPDQSGKVHIVTGGYTGVGLELSKILYHANATVYIAGRDASKAARALETLKSHAPSSRGAVHFLKLDLSDLSTIAGAAAEFQAREQRLDVLTNNAGVMMPPPGSRDAHGHELQMGTNCLGPFLFTKLLEPVLARTAETSPAGAVRVTWAGSLAVDIMSPASGVAWDESTGAPKVHGKQVNYGQTKAANLYLASEGARRDARSGVVHVCWNPGNLATELSRHSNFVEAIMVRMLCFPAIFGAYTELFAALSPRITPAQSGAYIVPWGRLSGFRADIAPALKAREEGGTGNATRFWEWCEKETAAYT